MSWICQGRDRNQTAPTGLGSTRADRTTRVTILCLTIELSDQLFQHDGSIGVALVHAVIGPHQILRREQVGPVCQRIGQDAGTGPGGHCGQMAVLHRLDEHMHADRIVVPLA